MLLGYVIPENLGHIVCYSTFKMNNMLLMISANIYFVSYICSCFRVRMSVRVKPVREKWDPVWI